MTQSIAPLQVKLEITKKLIKHQQQGKNCQPKNVAQLAGNLVDAMKSNARLMGIPQQMMRMAQAAVIQNHKALKYWNKHKCWGMSTPKPQGLDMLLMQAAQAVQTPVHMVLRAQTPVHLILTTDASKIGWGAHLNKGNQELANAAGTWEQEEANLHITHQEALGSALAVENLLPKIPPGCHLTVMSDAESTVWTWRKGSKIANLNRPIQKQFQELAQRGVYVTADHIQGKKNKRADWLSRNPDHKNYRLDPTWFHRICKHFRMYPAVDLFASRTNKQLKKYCSWRQDINSMGNALHIPWNKFQGWMNPPWELIHKCLMKVKTEKARVLFCLPQWKSAKWWGMLQSMMVTQPMVVRGEPLYQGPKGQHFPPPHWATLFGVLQG